MSDIQPEAYYNIDFEFRDFFKELEQLLEMGYEGVDQKLRSKLNKYWKRVSITHEFNMKLHYTWICQSQGHCFGQNYYNNIYEALFMMWNDHGHHIEAHNQLWVMGLQENYPIRDMILGLKAVYRNL